MTCPWYWQDSMVAIACGDARDVLAKLSADSVHCCITSPPYWGLRKYAGAQELDWSDGWRGGLGLEPSPELYLSHLVEIFREVKRVLRPDGVFWLNIGDSYAGSNKGSGDTFDQNGKQETVKGSLGLPVYQPSGYLKPLDLCLIPERLAIVLQQDGWYIRSRIAWNKQNPMPESMAGVRWERHKVKVAKGHVARMGDPIDTGVTNRHFDDAGLAEWQDCPGCPKCTPNDGLVLRRGSWRPTDSWEHIWMLTKTANYYADGEDVRQPFADGRMGNPGTVGVRHYAPGDRNDVGRPMAWTKGVEFGGCNLRSVWTFPSQACAFPGQHFASFPERLPEICIKASTSEYGVCAKCGSPWARVIEHKNMEIRRTDWGEKAGNRTASSGTMESPAESKTLSWRSTCTCGCQERVPATVLDPFMGSGTVLWVAKKLGRHAIGIDLSEAYCKLAIERNRQGGLDDTRRAARTEVKE